MKKIKKDRNKRSRSLPFQRKQSNTKSPFNLFSNMNIHITLPKPLIMRKSEEKESKSHDIIQSQTPSGISSTNLKIKPMNNISKTPTLKNPSIISYNGEFFSDSEELEIITDDECDNDPSIDLTTNDFTIHSLSVSHSNINQNTNHKKIRPFFYSSNSNPNSPTNKNKKQKNQKRFRFQTIVSDLNKKTIKTSINTFFDNSQQSLNNFYKKRLHSKTLPFMKNIPQNCLQLWSSNMESEVNRFAKISVQETYIYHHPSYSHTICWSERIYTDIIRAGKLFISGDVHEVFEFPKFKSKAEKCDLVSTAIHYLEIAVQHCILLLIPNVPKSAVKELAIKAVRQSLISLCQEFVNDPYFKYLKESCEVYNLQPVDIGLIGDQNVNRIKSWTPRLCICIQNNRIYTHVVRCFQCYELFGIEAIETCVYFGFKRTYSIDCLGGPPVVLPPVFLAKNDDNAYQISIPDEKVDHSFNIQIDSEMFMPQKL